MLNSNVLRKLDMQDLMVFVALQFRINAEDPKNNFLPSFGKITRYYAPGGPGVPAGRR